MEYSPTGRVIDRMQPLWESLKYAAPREHKINIAASMTTGRISCETTPSLIDLDFSDMEKRLTIMEIDSLMSAIWDANLPARSAVIYPPTYTSTSNRRGKSVFTRTWWAFNNFPQIMNPEPADAMRAAVLWAMEDLSRGL